MARAEPWRGSPTATSKPEFMHLISALNPSKRKNDIFYDIGCGYALPCVWIANRVKLAMGIENFGPRYVRALNNVKRSGYENIRIIKKSFQNVSFTNATIIHCVILLGISEYRKIQSETRPGTTIALCYPPMYPIRSAKVGGYYLIKTPFKKVENEREYARIVTGRKNASVHHVLKLFGRVGAKSLRWQISHSNYVWKKIGA